MIVGCAGEAPPNAPPRADSGPGDPGPEVVHKVSGKTLDFFVPATPLPESTVTTDGIAAVQMATSATDGSYELDVPTASTLYLLVTRPSYRPTRNLATSVRDEAVVQNVYVMSFADVNRQYASDGKPVTAGKAFLAAELEDATGQPLVGVTKAAIELTDLADQPVPGVIGPHFFGTQGDIDPALTLSQTSAGTSRVAFLDVPPGTFRFKVTYPDGVGGTTTSVVEVTASPDGAVVTAAGGPIPGAAVIDPTFATDVYPRLQTAANGGLGCANCHTANGSAGGVLVLDGGATAALAAITAAAAIDLAAPAASLLLTKPLYEPTPPQNHPNASFLDANDPDYKLILRWITGGAKP
ncbi:MAG: hypothetical protein M3680_27025 [Myxococcota bacterium]|nr:hypothetical protein [Myxococcota bacterium]